MTHAILLRCLLFALLWWVLTEGRIDSWGLGMVALLASLWISLYLLPPSSHRLSLAGLVGFLGFFVANSVSGGVQVSWMALRGRSTLQPAIVEFELTLPPGAPRFLLLYSLGLMPGTLGVALAGERLRFHVVDERLTILPKIDELQRHIAHIFGGER